MCGFPKDTYFFYKSQWTEAPMVHIFPHWNWKGKEGIEIPIVAYSNCESVELFLNGESLGEKVMGDRMDLVWLVPYEPGILYAKGRTGGQVMCEMEIVTSGPPAGIQLLADRESIKAHRQEVLHVEVDIVDKDSHFVPDASNRLHFRVEGEAEIMAVDNGDPMNEENFGSPTRKAFNGKCLVILKSTGRAGEITLYAESEGLEGERIDLLSVN
jgi:beta-galactosidase